MHARSHTHQTPRKCTLGDTTCHTHYPHSPAQTLSNTSSRTRSHTPRARALRAPPQSLGPSIVPPGKGPRAPKLSFPLALPAPSQSSPIPPSLGRQPRMSGRAPSRFPGRGPRPLSPRPAHLAAAAAACSQGARLGAPPLAPQPQQQQSPAGRHPGAGAGPRPA